MNPTKRREILTTLPSLLWLGIFVLIPTIIVFVLAFKPSTPSGGIGVGWSLDAIRKLADPIYLTLIVRTFIISVLTTVICIAVALPVSYAMARARSEWRSRLLLLVIVPFWTNFLIRVFAWKQILHAEGALAQAMRSVHLLGSNDTLLYTPSAVVLISIYTFLPFAILPMFAAAEKFEFALLDAARDLGCSPLRAFLSTFVPGIRNGIVTAFVIVFIPMLGSYVIPDIVGGRNGEMLGNKIAQRNFSDRDLPQAAAISAALTLIVLLPLAATRLRRRASAV